MFRHWPSGGTKFFQNPDSSGSPIPLATMISSLVLESNSGIIHVTAAQPNGSASFSSHHPPPPNPVLCPPHQITAIYPIPLLQSRPSIHTLQRKKTHTPFHHTFLSPRNHGQQPSPVLFFPHFDRRGVSPKKRWHSISSYARVVPPAPRTYTCELRPPYADAPPSARSHRIPFPSLRCQKLKAEPSVKVKRSHLIMGSGCGHQCPISISLSLSLSQVEEKGTRVPFPLMAKRLAAPFPPFPLALLLLLAVSSPPIAAAKPVIKDDVSCTMCSSCDNPCQPAASPPPPPPSSTAECPPPPSNPGAISYYSPPPPDVYSSPPPPSSSGGGGSGGGGSYYYPPPPNGYYQAPPPPNPFLPYFPFYYYSPPPPNKYYSGSLSLKPLSSIPLLLLLLLLLLF